MNEPKICENCIENDHEHCDKKKNFAVLRGIICECFVCWSVE